MHARPRRSVRELTKTHIPEDPGVYVWYRDGVAIYVGKADRLRTGALAQAPRPRTRETGSAFRRNVAQELDIADANDIRTKAHEPTAGEAQAVRRSPRTARSRGSTDTKADALRLESRMKRAWRPRLTRM